MAEPDSIILSSVLISTSGISLSLLLSWFDDEVAVVVFMLSLFLRFLCGGSLISFDEGDIGVGVVGVVVVLLSGLLFSVSPAVVDVDALDSLDSFSEIK